MPFDASLCKCIIDGQDEMTYFGILFPINANK